MTVNTTTGGAPLVVGLGGTLRANSSTERALRYCLDAVEQLGGRAKLFRGQDLDLPMYAPHELERTPKALELVSALRDADAVVVGSPGSTGRSPDWSRTRWTTSRICAKTRGSISTTPRGAASAAPTDGRRRSAHWVSCAASDTLRSWPTPLGVAINSADQIFDSAGQLADPAVQTQLEMLAGQVLTFARVAWSTT